MLGPIFARECLTLPRRGQHYLVRTAYLGFLWVLLWTAWQALVGWERSVTLGDLAHFGRLAFALVAFLQLTLLIFFAALTAVSSVALEKDRQTLDLLLLTDLRNREIVLGKLAGSLLQIGVLVVLNLGLGAILLLLGGIAAAQVVEAGLLTAAAAFAAGSLGTAVAFWRERTFPALALTALGLVLYLGAVQCLQVPAALAETRAVHDTPWLGWQPADWRGLQASLDPYLALQQTLSGADDAGRLPPAFTFAAVALVLGMLVNGWGIVRLRVWNPPRQPARRPVVAEEDKPDRLVPALEARSRPVWGNPILWREVRTRAYGRRLRAIKAAYFLAVVLVAWFALEPFFTAAPPPAFAAARGMVPVTVLSLLLVSAQAVTAITSERDRGALDLLLVTDLTPREFVFGKLLGIVWNTKEFLLPPFVLAAIYATLGSLATPPAQHPGLLLWRNVESLVCLVLALAVLYVFTIVLGVHVALRADNSRAAILHALGTVFFLSVGTLVCIYLILASGRFEYQWGAFLLFVGAGVGGLWWVLSGDRPAPALTLASGLCPVAVLYAVMNILVARPGSAESADPLWPCLAISGAFGFGIAAMLVPLLSDFDTALGRTGRS